MTNARTTAPFALARYRQGDAIVVGLVAGERIRPLDAADLGASDLNRFLAESDWGRLARLAEADGPWLSLDDVTLTSPVEPRQVLQAGANYRTHVVQLIMGGLSKGDPQGSPDEIRARAEKIMDVRAASGRPFIFLGLAQCVVGDDVALALPSYSEVHDWELELAVVIGREAFRVSQDDALSHVAGYTISNDVTTRDLVFPPDVGDIGADWFRAKNAPGFLPTGPFLVPASFVDPSNLSITLELNGDVMQDATTAELLFDVASLISTASQTLPLLPGDLLLTGSPAGNGQHWKRFLRDGDVMTGTIEGLGTQTVRCISEVSA